MNILQKIERVKTRVIVRVEKPEKHIHLDNCVFKKGYLSVDF